METAVDWVLSDGRSGRWRAPATAALAIEGLAVDTAYTASFFDPAGTVNPTFICGTIHFVTQSCKCPVCLAIC